MAVRSPLRRRRPREEEPPGGASQGVAYDAFISYSHAVDGRLAPALQSALQRFSKPWYRLRALRVFRDNASLSANPALWTSIESALGRSRWFILLASPGSAQSPWVAREVETWLDRHGTERLLLAVTDGELSWDNEEGRFKRGPDTPLPEVLLTAFEEEPRFIDLRWARTGEHLSLSDPRFRDAVADLAAPIHGRPKDDLVGEEVRQHRRAVRLARAAVTTLVLLLVAAAAAAVLAVSQRNEARSQRDRAEAEARIATSRQLAAQATALRDEQYDLALLLAVEAYRTEGTPEARRALTTMLEGNPKLAAFVGPPAPQPGPAPGRVALTPDGDLLAVADWREVALWDTATQELVRTLKPAGNPPGAISAPVVFSDDGSLVAAAWLNDEVTVWETATGEIRHTLTFDGHALPMSLAFGPSETYVAAGYSDPKESRIVVWSLLDDSTWLTIPTDLVAHVAIDEALTTVMGGASDGRFARFDLASGVRREAGGGFAPIRMSGSAYSDDSRLYASANFEGDLTVYDLDKAVDVEHPTPGQPRAYTAMSFSGDRDTLAAAGEGIATIWRLDRPVPPVQLQGFSGITSDLAMSGDGSKLAIVSGSRVALFDLDQRYRLAEEVLVPDIYLPASVVRLAGVAFSGDGRFVAWLHPGTHPDEEPYGIQRVLVRGTDEGTLRADLLLDDVATALALSPDGSLLALGGETVEIHTLDGGAPRRLAEAGDELVGQVAFSPDGSLLTVVWRNGVIARYDVAAGEPLVQVPSSFPSPVIAVSPDGGLVRLADSNAGAVIEVDLDASNPEPRHVSEGGNGAVATAVGPGAVRALAFSDGLVGVGGGPVEGLRFQLASVPTSLGFAPDGSSFVAAANDGTVVMWDLQAKAEVSRLRVRDLGSEPVVAAFRPEGDPLVAIAAVDGSLTLWHLGIEASLAEACEISGRNLTEEEWDRYIGSIRPYSKTCQAYSF
jgi:WD40 repeat protein